MKFLVVDDFKGTLGTGVLNQLRGTLDANLAQAEQNALSELDPLKYRYDVDAELSKTGTDRNSVMIRIVVNLTAYWLYNIVPDLDIPSRISDNYNNTLRDIELFANGKKHSTLTGNKDDDGAAVTKFEYGFDTKRRNNPFN